MADQTFKLNTGATIPVLGLGMFPLDAGMPAEEASERLLSLNPTKILI